MACTQRSPVYFSTFWGKLQTQQPSLNSKCKYPSTSSPHAADSPRRCHGLQRYIQARKWYVNSWDREHSHNAQLPQLCFLFFFTNAHRFGGLASQRNGNTGVQ